MDDTVALSTLLQTHDNAAVDALAIPTNIGDAYLLEHNELFRNVRRCSSRLQIRFSADYNNDWKTYDAFPLLSLWLVLRTRTIPFRDNVTALRALVDRNPAISLSARFLTSALKHNYLLHETTHCIAHELITPTTISVVAPLTPQRRAVLRGYVGEAAAIAAEAIAIAIASSPIQLMFLEVNTYFRRHVRRDALVRRCIDCIGLTRTYELLMYAFLFANLLQERDLMARADRVYRLVTEHVPPARDRSWVRELLSHAGRLDHQFREETSFAYCSLMGSTRALIELRRLSAMRLCQTNESLRNALRRLAEEVAGGATAYPEAASAASRH
jgi:hypothetical protein